MAFRWRPRFSLLTLLLASLLCGSGALLWQHHEPWQVRMTIRENNLIGSAGYSNRDTYIYTITQTTRDPASDLFQMTVKIYERETGHLVSTIAGPPAHGFIASLGEKYIQSQSYKSIEDEGDTYLLHQIWRADTLQLLKAPDIAPEAFRLSCISPQENFAMLSTAHKFGIVTLPALTSLVPIQDEPMAINGFSPDEKWLAISTMSDKVVRLIPTEPGASERKFSSNTYTKRVKFSPDSRLIAVETMRPYTTMIYDVASSAVIGRFGGEFGTFSDDSTRVVTFSETFDSTGMFAVNLWPLNSSSAPIKFLTNSPFGIRVSQDRIFNSSPFSALDIASAAVIFEKPGYAEFSKDLRFAHYWTDEKLEQLWTSDGIVLHTFEKRDQDEPYFGLSFANEHSECSTYRYDLDKDRKFAREMPDSQYIPTKEVQIWSRRRPEFWYGYAWIWEFWLALGLAIGLIWSSLQPTVRVAQKGK